MLYDVSLEILQKCLNNCLHCSSNSYSDEALELMRDNCSELRDLAIIDMLASTGMRVGEMVLLNRNDIDFNERECIVFG